MTFGPEDFRKLLDRNPDLMKGPIPDAVPPPTAKKPAKPPDDDEDDDPVYKPGKDVWEGRLATSRENITWVASYLPVKMKAEQAPSSTAWALRLWVLDDKKNLAEFWKKYLDMAKSEKEAEDKAKERVDDGRAVLAALQRVREKFNDDRDALLRRSA